jgi:hypothetical protein
MARRRRGLVPRTLQAAILEALEEVEERTSATAEAIAGSAPLEQRRALRVGLGEAFERADRLLREAVGLTRGRSHREWSRWRRRLAGLSTAKQKALFGERDDLVCLRMGAVLAVDTGMSGPAIGELQHGASKPPGAVARYGVDVDGLFTPRRRPEPSAASATAVPAASASVRPSTAAAVAEPAQDDAGLPPAA